MVRGGGLARTQARDPPAEPWMMQQIGVAHTLHALLQTQMPVRQERILLARMEQSRIPPHNRPFVGTRRARLGPVRMRLALQGFDRRSEPVGCPRAHGHLAVVEACAAFRGHQIYPIADAVQVRPFGPHRLHAVSRPEDRFAVVSVCVMRRAQPPRLRVNPLGPHLGLPFPARAYGRSCLRPVHGAVKVLEDVWIDPLGALDPVRAAPWSLKRIGFDDEVALACAGRLDRLRVDPSCIGRVQIDAGDRACDHVLPADHAQCRRIQSPGIKHEGDQQPLRHRLVDGVPRKLPVRDIVRDVDRQSRHQFERGIHQGHSLPALVPHPAWVGVHAPQYGIGDVHGRGRCGHRGPPYR